MCNEIGEAVLGEIRTAQREDIPQILGLIRELALYENLTDQVVANEELLSESLFGERAFVKAIVADVEGAAVGFAVFFHSFSTFLARPGIYLEDLFVKPPYRRRGIGTALVKYVAREAHALGCGRLEWSVLNWNDPAIRFYELLGAVAMEDWTVYRVTGEALQHLAESD